METTGIKMSLKGQTYFENDQPENGSTGVFNEGMLHTDVGMHAQIHAHAAVTERIVV